MQVMLFCHLSGCCYISLLDFMWRLCLIHLQYSLTLGKIHTSINKAPSLLLCCSLGCFKVLHLFQQLCFFFRILLWLILSNLSKQWPIAVNLVMCWDFCYVLFLKEEHLRPNVQSFNIDLVPAHPRVVCKYSQRSVFIGACSTYWVLLSIQKQAVL